MPTFVDAIWIAHDGVVVCPIGRAVNRVLGQRPSCILIRGTTKVAHLMHEAIGVPIRRPAPCAAGNT